MYRTLFIFVEGPDDERFIESLIKPILKSKYDDIRIIRYANKSAQETVTFISTIQKKVDWDYLFLCDMDARGNKSLCIASRKQREISTFQNLLEVDKIVVVKEEIESWYMAGVIDHKNYGKLKGIKDTEDMTKEEFRSLIPRNFKSTTDFMIQVLHDFSIEAARRKNKSLTYFFDKHVAH